MCGIAYSNKLIIIFGITKTVNRISNSSATPNFEAIIGSLSTSTLMKNILFSYLDLTVSTI